MNIELNNIEDYNFIGSPNKIAWDKNISYRFENIIQSQEFSNQFNNFVSNEICCSQNAIDDTTNMLTNLMVSAAMQVDTCPKLTMKNKASRTAGSRRINKKRLAHPKWHDTSCY